MPGFVEVCFDTKRISGGARRVTVDSRAFFTFTRETREPKRLAERYLENLRKYGYKIGFRLKRDQSMVARYRSGKRFVALRESPAVAREFTRAFGADRGEKWVGFEHDPAAPPSFVFERNVSSYDQEFVFTNVRAMPQLVPVVYAYAKDPVVKHYMLGVRILSRDFERTRVCVRAVHP